MKPPVGVKVVSALHLYFAGLYFFALFGMTRVLMEMWRQNHESAVSANMSDLREFLAGDPLHGYAFLAVLIFLWIGTFVAGSFFLLLAVYLWKLANWARILDIVLICVGLIFGPFSLLSALTHLHKTVLYPHMLNVALRLLILFYLFTPRVKQAFAKTLA